MSSILSARGQQMVEVGGDRCWRQRVIGEFCVSYQWLHVGKKEPQACMTIFPTTPKIGGGAYAIPQENAWEYVDSRGYPTQNLIVAAFNAAVTMGYGPTDKQAQNKIITLIVEGLSDLVEMPSDQPDQLEIKRALYGIEATARVGGQVIHQEVL